MFSVFGNFSKSCSFDAFVSLFFYFLFSSIVSCKRSVVVQKKSNNKIIFSYQNKKGDRMQTSKEIFLTYSSMMLH